RAGGARPGRDPVDPRAASGRREPRHVGACARRGRANRRHPRRRPAARASGLLRLRAGDQESPGPRGGGRRAHRGCPAARRAVAIRPAVGPGRVDVDSRQRFDERDRCGRAAALAGERPPPGYAELGRGPGPHLAGPRDRRHARAEQRRRRPRRSRPRTPHRHRTGDPEPARGGAKIAGSRAAGGGEHAGRARGRARRGVASDRALSRRSGHGGRGRRGRRLARRGRGRGRRGAHRRPPRAAADGARGRRSGTVLRAASVGKSLMWLIRAALRRPITVLVAVAAMALLSIVALTRTRIDILPDLNVPTIYVAQPYGVLSPQQMEGFISYYYEYLFLYIDGIESVEAKSIQGTALLRLSFHPGTDMSQALAQTISYVNRAKAFMPPGTVPPFVIRFDAGTLPVGYLVFSSASRTLAQIQDLALNRVRPAFATLPGVSSPPPFGASQRTIVLNVDPDRLRSYGRSPEDVVRALANGNIGDKLVLVATDSTVGRYEQLLDIPLTLGPGAAVYIRDVATVADAADVLTGYALFNGKRTIYIPVTKRPDASTISVVNEVKS